MSIKFIFASTAALALVAGTPAFAAKAQSEQASTASTANYGGKTKSERRTCRTFIGSASRMKKDRLCLTRAEWKKFEATQSE